MLTCHGEGEGDEVGASQQFRNCPLLVSKSPDSQGLGAQSRGGTRRNFDEAQTGSRHPIRAKMR